MAAMSALANDCHTKHNTLSALFKTLHFLLNVVTSAVEQLNMNMYCRATSQLQCWYSRTKAATLLQRKTKS